jgi:hypothetical protein
LPRAVERCHQRGGQPGGAAVRVGLCRGRALEYSRIRRVSRVRPPPDRGSLLGVSDTPKPLGRRASRLPRKGRQHPYLHGWLRCAHYSSSLTPSARSRGGDKVDHCLILCSSVAHVLWSRDGRLSQTRHLWSQYDRAPSPCRRTPDREDRPESSGYCPRELSAQRWQA